MKILITGANGFLGRHLVAACRAEGHQVRALVRPTAAVEDLGWDQEVEIFRADLRSHPALEQAFAGIDVLVHLAACVLGSNEAQFTSTAVATERLLEAMAKTNTRRLVLASSLSVHAWLEVRDTLDEDAPQEPLLYQRGGYAVAKVWQERVARRLAQTNGWGLTILRPGFIWGEGHTTIPGMGWRVGPVRLVLGIDRRLPLTHVDNCADAFLLAAHLLATKRTQDTCEVYDLIDSDHVTAWRYLGEYMDRTPSPGLRIPLPFILLMTTARLATWTSRFLFKGRGKLPGILVPCLISVFKPLRFSNRRIRDQLGWTPPLSFSEALERSFDGKGPSVP